MDGQIDHDPSLEEAQGFHNSGSRNARPKVVTDLSKKPASLFFDMTFLPALQFDLELARVAQNLLSSRRGAGMTMGSQTIA